LQACIRMAHGLWFPSTKKNMSIMHTATKTVCSVGW
jgi:hypothetical protein